MRSEPWLTATVEIRTSEVAMIVPVRSLMTMRATLSGMTSMAPRDAMKLTS